MYLLMGRENVIKSELEILYKGLLSDISHIPEEKNCSIEIKMLKTCENYCNVTDTNKKLTSFLEINI